MTSEQYPADPTSNYTAIDLDGYSSGTYGMGETATTADSSLIGRYISDLQFYMQNVEPIGSGNIKATVKNSSNVILHTFWTVANSTLSTDAQWTANTSESYASPIAEGDYLAVEVTTSSAIPRAFRNSGGTAYDGTDSNGLTFLPITARTQDTFFKMTYSDDPPVTDIKIALPQIPEPKSIINSAFKS